MSYWSDVLALPGLTGAWKLDDAAGSTTAADSGPNNLPLTYSQAKVDGPALIAGIGSSVQGNAGVTVSRTAGISALRTAKFTVAGFFKGAKPASGNRGLFGINNRGILYLSANGLQGKLNGGTVVSSPWFVDNNEGMMGALTYDGVWLRSWVNGDLFGAVRATIDPTDVSTAFEILSLGGSSAWDGAAGGVFALDRAAHQGELMSLYRGGTLVAPQALVLPWLDGQDSASTVAATSAEAGRDTTTGGLIRALSPVVSTSGSKHRAADHFLRQVGFSAAAPSVSDDPIVVARDVLRGILDALKAWTRRPVVARTRYFSAVSGWVLSDLANPGYDVACAAGTQVAELRWMAQAPRDHWTYQVAAGTVEQIIASMDPSIDRPAGTGWTVPTFPFKEMGVIMLYLRDVAPRGTFNRWLEKLVAFGQSIYAGKGSAGSEWNWYANGNIEIEEITGYYCLWKLTGDQTWKDRYDGQWDRTIAPPDTIGSLYGGISGGTKKFGLRNVADDSLVSLAAFNAAGDGASARWYLGESNGSTKMGWDYNYALFQAALLAEHWHLSEDPRALRLLNGIHRAYLEAEISSGVPRVNRSNWQVDPSTVGLSPVASRVTTSFETLVGPTAALVWSGRGGSIDPTWPASIWLNNNENNFRSNYRTPGSATPYRMIRSLGLAVASTSLWPGSPAPL